MISNYVYYVLLYVYYVLYLIFKSNDIKYKFY